MSDGGTQLTTQAQYAGIDIIARSGGAQVKASYPGGAYISLTFGEFRKATEVINVWDSERARPEIAFTVAGVAIQLQAWMESQQEDNPGWYEQYIENGRYDQ